MSGDFGGCGAPRGRRSSDFFSRNCGGGNTGDCDPTSGLSSSGLRGSNGRRGRNGRKGVPIDDR